MGIRQRIFFYVTVGLLTMFGLLIFVGLRSLDQATDQVFEARLSTAKSLALILERDLIHVAADVQGFGSGLVPAVEGSEFDTLVDDLLVHLAHSDSFAFFQADGLAVLNEQGRPLAAAGAAFTAVLPETTDPDGDAYQVLSPDGGPTDTGGFAVVATRFSDGSEQVWVLVHLAARNSSRSFLPEDYLQSTRRQPATPDSEEDGSFHLEVIGPQGDVVLGIGSDEVPGGRSPHYEAVFDRSPMIEPIVLRHLASSESDTESHVMGVVPLSEFGFTLILEQPIDVALELPRRLRDQLIIWSAIGFALALLIAWFTTRAVVRPTQQLTLAADRIGSGDLDTPVRVNARDEFGVLADRFESMRQQIANAYEAVEEANQVLESRVAERTAQLGNLLNHVISAQEDERRRLARELHDETAQTLGAISIALGRASDTISQDSERSVDQLTQARDMVGSLIEDTRRLILDLRPMILDDLGLIPAIRWYVESRLSEIGIDAILGVDATSDRLPAHIETALFRIVQEAINNVVKHSGARKVDIAFSSRPDAVMIVVSDDGKGFDQPTAAGAQNGHLGLAGMRERVALLGGQMSVRSKTGQGTRVTVEIPLTGTGT